MSELYLIIGPDRLTGVLGPLIEQKIRRGYKVQIKSFSSPEDIRKCVLDLSPKCLLLVGDTDVLPGFKLKLDGGEILSDSYFSMRSDADFLPSALTGRLCSSDPEEIKRICGLLLSYPGDLNPRWRRRVVLTGWCPRSPLVPPLDFPAHAGKTDWDLNYMASILDGPSNYFPFNKEKGELSWKDAGYKCLKVIGSYYDVVREFQSDSGAHPTAVGVRMWGTEDSSKKSLINTIEAGALIVRYVGHGGVRSWPNIGIKNASVSETLGVKDVEALKVGARVPLVLSACCNSGKIQNDSLAEVWQRKCKAIGVLAADGLSDIKVFEQMPNYILQQLVGMQNRRIGEAILSGLRQLYEEHPDFGKDEGKVYRYLGDPDTMLAAPEDDGRLECRNFSFSFGPLKGPKKFCGELELRFPGKVRRATVVLGSWGIKASSGVNFSFSDHGIKVFADPENLHMDGGRVKIKCEVPLEGSSPNFEYKGFVTGSVFALMDPVYMGVTDA